jgi:hypothetical protein
MAFSRFNQSRLFSFLLVMILLTYSCSGNQKQNNTNELLRILHVEESLTEDQLKQRLMEKECSKPVQYLEGSVSHVPIYRNILSLKVKGLRLKFKLSNYATIAVFKDLKVNVALLSKTGATILERTISIYDFISPNVELNYQTEIEISNQEYIDFEEIKWEIVDASCI